jgi:hypothetical protein
LATWNRDQPEITDLIIQHDPTTLARVPVRKAEVIGVFWAFRNRKALRAIEPLPAHCGVLDNWAVDRELEVLMGQSA